MFMKLNFTSDKTIVDIFRIINEVINQSSITDATTLGTYLTANADATVKAGYDPANSTIIKTVGLSTTKSHYARGSVSAGTSVYWHLWTLEFQSYDSSRKYYIQQNCATGSAISTTKIGTSITGGTMASSQLPISSTDTAGTDGTALTLSGTVDTGSQNTVSGTSGASNIRTLWLQINDNGLIWATTNTASYNLGFGNTYTDATKFSGPWIFGQYARHDYHGTDANGIIPLMYTNTGRALGMGFGGSAFDWQQSHNTMATNPGYTTGHPFRVFNLVNAHPQAGTSWPIVVAPVVSWGLGQRFDDVYALSGSAQGTVTSTTATSYGAVIFETVNTRYPSADLKTQGYAMLPICWRHTYYGCTGGNMTAKSGYYLYNGDYYPGDQFSYNGKTYVLFPTYIGYSNRVGIAVPME